MCQKGVMTESETVTLAQDGAVNFMSIAVFLFSKFDGNRFFSPPKSNGLSSLLFAKRKIIYTIRDYRTVFYTS